jgi:isoquinoline 1-oxidoreductase alpha subunit
MRLNVNGQSKDLGSVDPDMPLLWALRDDLGLTGTKFGCGVAQCGACTVHIDGVAQKSCSITVGSVGAGKVTTIEGAKGKVAAAVTAAWQQFEVAQCGYCQSGQIMAATALLAATPKPTDKQIEDAMTGNICRCATYVRIKAAIKQASATL